MRRSPRLPLAVVAVALLALTAAGCKPGDKAGADTTAAKSADAKPGQAGDQGDEIPGLPTEKDKVSYMIGMAQGKQLDPVKDEIDIDVLVKALKSTVDGDKLLLTEEQAQKIGQDFSAKMQAKHEQKLKADAEKNAAEGAKFLAENAKKPGVVTTKSGLQYQVIDQGKGARPADSDTVKVNYKGSLLDGTVFDDTAEHGSPAELPLAQVVPGWREGIELMPVGSKYRFWIPASQGYGEQGIGPIPGNATLVFEVELLDIVKPGHQ